MVQSSIFGAGLGLLFSVAAAGAATPDQLYQTWQQNSRQQPDIAEKAAQDYLQAAPDGPHAQGLQVWLDAYHKSLASLLARAPQSLWKPVPKQAPKQAAAKSPVPQGGPAIAQAPPSAQPAPVEPPQEKLSQDQRDKPQPAPAAAAQPSAKLASAAPPPAKPSKAQGVKPELVETPPPARMVPPAPSRESAAKDQPAVPPQTGEGHSLVETLAFIADKIDGEGRINFLAQFRDAAAGRDIVQRLSYLASKVTMDPNRCRLSFHWRVEQDGKATTDEDRVVELRLAKSAAAETLDQALTDLNTGPRPLIAHTQPTLYAVHIARWDKPAGDNLYFHGKDMAARVAAAGGRALEMCEEKGRKRGRRR